MMDDMGSITIFFIVEEGVTSVIVLENTEDDDGEETS